MKSRKQLFIDAREFAQLALENADPGHDILHIDRVFETAMKFARKRKANQLVVGLAGLLHDVGDAKFCDGDETQGALMIRQFLEKKALPREVIEQVVWISENLSFRKSKHFNGDKSIEFQIVQDADRLDAIGAVGIARAFSYGAYKRNPFYFLDDAEAGKRIVRNKIPTTIWHFYEKLLLLKELMNTDEGRAEAQRRHAFMLRFLKQFYREAKLKNE